MLAYKIPGFQYPLLEMDSNERDWYVRRLMKQLHAEAAAYKKGSKR